MDPEWKETAFIEQLLIASKNAPIAEIGSYCGKSTIYIGHGLQRK